MSYETINKKDFYILFMLLTFPLIVNGYMILFADSATYIGAYILEIKI